jgi:hypothetical protein
MGGGGRRERSAVCALAALSAHMLGAAAGACVTLSAGARLAPRGSALQLERRSLKQNSERSMLLVCCSVCETVDAMRCDAMCVPESAFNACRPLAAAAGDDAQAAAARWRRGGAACV